MTRFLCFFSVARVTTGRDQFQVSIGTSSKSALLASLIARRSYFVAANC